MDVRMPDGTIVTNVPDGTTQAELSRRLGLAKQPAADPAEVSGPLQAGFVAAGRGLDRLASGLRDITPAPIRNALDRVDQFTGAQTPTTYRTEIANNEAEYAKVSEAFPQSTFVGEVAPTLTARNPIGAAVLGGLEIGDPMERVARAGMNYGASKAGEFVGGKVADAFANRSASKTAKLAAIPPTQTNPTIVNRLLEGVSGKLQTAQSAAIKNQVVTDKLAKQALSLPEDVPLSREAIGTVRSAAGEVYKVVKNFGRVDADQEFRAALNGVTGEYRQLVQEFPSQKNASINALLKDLSLSKCRIPAALSTSRP